MEDGKILVKKLPWRSESKCGCSIHMHMHTLAESDDTFLLYTELDQLVEKLDTFALEAAKSKKNFIPDRVEHVIVTQPSTVPPPPDAPNWALKPE